MHRPRRRKLSSRSAALVALTLLAGMLAMGAADAAAPAAAPAIQRSVRTVTRGAAIPFPTGQTVTPVQGIQNPEIPPEPEEEGDAAAARAVQRHRQIQHSLSHRPSARMTAQLRAAEAAADLTVPTVTPKRVAGSNPGLDRSFEGLNFFDQRFANNGNQFSVEPPDQGLCVGNGFVPETINDVLQVYSPGGRPLSPVTDLNTFYGYPAQIDRTTGVRGPFVTDPSCYYDPAHKRFFHLALTLDVVPDTGAFTGTNHLDIAVSQTSSPLGGWNIYRLPVQDDGTQGTPSHTDCPCIGDYPHLGADKYGFYVSTNEYPFSDDPGVFGNNFNGAQVYAFSKAALAAGAATVNVVQFENLVLSDGTPGFTVWPAQVPDNRYATRDHGTEYFLSSSAAEEALNEAGLDNRIGLWTLTNSRSLDSANPAPDLTSAILGSETYGVPPLSEQKAGPVPLRDCIVTVCLEGIGPSPVREVEGPLDSNDSRMQQTWLAGGRLYGALDTIANVAGNIKAASAFFVVDPVAKAITRQGYVGVAGNNVNYPAIAVLPNGKGVMAFTLVGGNRYPSAAYAPVSGGGNVGAVHVAGRGVGPQDGFSEYVFFNGAGTDPPSARPRWGDYSAAVTAGGNLWFASEWIAQRCTFTEYLADTTCGGTRGALGNWSTRLSRLGP
ncbi:MAG: hypothetical protein ACJ75A_07880 [Actinomycetes bacterium]